MMLVWVSALTAYQRRLVIRMYIGREGRGQPSKHWLSRRAGLVRRVGIAVISFQV